MLYSGDVVGRLIVDFELSVAIGRKDKVKMMLPAACCCRTWNFI